MMKLMSDAYIVARGATLRQYLGMKEKQALSPRSADLLCKGVSELPINGPFL